MITTLLLGAALLAPSDSTAPRTLAAHRIAPGQAVPAIDGRLDDAAWAQAPVAGGFTQQYPDAGAPATQRTEARIAYDDQAVYVAIRAFDTAPDSIAAQLGRRDATGVYSDWVQVVFDSYHDRRTGYRFAVNPRGVKKDVFHFDDDAEDLTWDAVWDVATSVDAEGWTAEFRIPLSQLRFKPQEAGQAWGLNVVRDLARREERSWWSPMLPNQAGFSSRFGTLTGLTGLRSPRRLEVAPYTVGSVTRAPGDAADPFYRETDPFLSMGADLKYGLSSDFTLTATLNPDFGQVEADPSQVNLSAYETFLPEQRPFFVEGTDIFRFGLGAGDGDFGSESLFYTRRIGRQPQGMGRVPGDAAFVDAPNSTTILGAAKLTGKTAGGWSIGVMEALTAREEAAFIGADGLRDSRAVEPLTNYGVVRVSRDLSEGRTAFGGIASATNRFMEGADSLSFLPTAAYAGGFDVRHRWGQGGRYQLSAWVLGSHVAGDSTAIDRLQRSSARFMHRPDADHVDYDPGRTSLTGGAAQVEFMKIGGGNWNYGGVANLRTAGFEANDLGYQRDADQALVALFGGYNQPRAGGILRSWRVNFNGWTGMTLGGERTALGGNVNGGAQFTNLWSINGGFNREMESVSDRALRGGPSLVRPGSWNGWLNVGTDRRRSVFAGAGVSGWVEDETDGASWSAWSDVTWRASSQAQLTLSPSYSQSRSAWQFTGSRSMDGAPHYVFSGMERRTAALTARLNYTFAPTLSFQLYAQPFIAAGRATGFREVRLAEGGGRVAESDDFDGRFQGFAPGDLTDCGGWYGVRGGAGAGCADEGAFDYTFDDPSFNVKEFRSTAVVRWEYRPGSALFVVWSQGRQDFLPDGSFRLGRDVRRLFGMDEAHEVPATNVLLVKFSYWLNL